MTIGDRIKARRIQVGLSVDQVAERIGKNRATVYRYESNDIEKFPLDILPPLAEALNTTPAYLMGWTEIPDPRPATGHPSDLTPDETDLVYKYQALDYGGKLRIRSALDVEYSLRPGRTDDRVLQQA